MRQKYKVKCLEASESIEYRMRYAVDVYEAQHLDKERYELFDMARHEVYDGRYVYHIVSGTVLLYNVHGLYGVYLNYNTLRSSTSVRGDVEDSVTGWLDIKTEEQFFQKSLLFDFDRLQITLEVLKSLQDQYHRLDAVYDKINLTASAHWRMMNANTNQHGKL